MSAWVSSFDTDEADTVILGFGEVSVGGISDSADKELMSFGGRGLGTIACRLLYVFAGSKINLFYEDDEKPVTRNLDGGEDGLIVFVAPRPKSRLEIKAGSERLDGSRFMYIDYLTSRPAVPSGKVYVTPLGRRRDIGCYLELIRELYVKYYTEGENDCVLNGCRNAAKGLVDYAPQALEIPLLSEPRVINALKEIKRDLPASPAHRQPSPEESAPFIWGSLRRYRLYLDRTVYPRISALYGAALHPRRHDGRRRRPNGRLYLRFVIRPREKAFQRREKRRRNRGRLRRRIRLGRLKSRRGKVR